MKVLVPLPDADFDTTEVAVPWRLLTEAGHEVVFATERGGAAPACDPRLLDGVLFGQLGARAEPIAFYARDAARPSVPRAASPGATSTRPATTGCCCPAATRRACASTSASAELQRAGRRVLGDRAAGRRDLPRRARARAHDGPATGRSVLAGRRTTCLPKYMERGGYFLTAWRLGRYYRTYPAYVEDEVVARARRHRDQFERGPRGTRRAAPRTDDAPAFVVEDGRYVSARWPGDAYLFAEALHRTRLGG